VAMESSWCRMMATPRNQRFAPPEAAKQRLLPVMPSESGQLEVRSAQSAVTTDASRPAHRPEPDVPMVDAGRCFRCKAGKFVGSHRTSTSTLYSAER
jgi:hypothetical protein